METEIDAQRNREVDVQRKRDGDTQAQIERISHL